MTENTAAAWPRGIFAITIFVTDLPASKAFYSSAFGCPIVNEDAESVAFRMGDTILNLLITTAAPELIEPATVGDPASGSRFMPTISVDDVDARASTLQNAGIALLNGPMDRPWGMRTAAFADPDAHVWEIAQSIG